MYFLNKPPRQKLFAYGAEHKIYVGIYEYCNLFNISDVKFKYPLDIFIGILLVIVFYNKFVRIYGQAV